MKIAIVDESAARASIIEEGLAELDAPEIHILTQREGLLARIEEIGPDVVLIDLGNPSRDVEAVVWGAPAALVLTLAARLVIGNGAPFTAIFWIALALTIAIACWRPRWFAFRSAGVPAP